jgi:uncharacterized membrane protein SpoIIM required for sporulation
MKRSTFITQRTPAWRRFEGWLARTESGSVSGLSAEDVFAFSQEFRGLCHDLAIVRSRGFGRDLDRHVNDLVVRGHSVLYGAPAGQAHAAGRFLASGFPRLLRAHASYFLLALALFVLPALASGIVVGRNSALAARVLPGAELERLDEMYSEPSPEQKNAVPSTPFGMTGFYVWNNAGIAFRCFATGIFLGLGTLYYLVFNGIFLGTVAGFLVDHGHSERFFSFVVGHGAFELTAIVVSGAAGLRIGHAVVHPAPFSWSESLRIRGRDGAQLALGAGAMLVVAACIEACWSPLPIPPAIKYAAGGAFWIFVIAYFLFAGRDAGPATLR